MTKTKKIIKSKSTTYNEDNIKALFGLDKVRGNVAMYLGELGDAMMFRAIKEPVENSRDEYEAGRNNAIYVAYNNKTSEYVIADCAQGIPVGDKVVEGIGKISTLTLILTELHAGGKFDNTAYETSGGTHGIGISALNAVSTEFEVWTCREKQWYYQGFSCGKAKTEVKKVADSFLKKQFGYLSDIKKKFKRLGSIVRFVPDQSVISVDANRTKKLKTYTQAILQPEVVEDYLRFMSTMNPKLHLTLHDLEKNKVKEFYNDKGLSGIIGNIIQDRELEGLGKPFEFDSSKLKVAIQWSNYHDTDLFRSYVNSSPTVDHGTHVTGFRAAMTKVLKDYMPKKSSAFKPDDLYVGAIAIINWKMNSAQFSGQVKDKLVSKIDNEVMELLTLPLTEFFKKNKSLAKAIIKRASEVAASRENLAKVMKGMSEVKKGQGSLPDKLYEAPNCKPHERELYLVEGDSAGGCFIGSTSVKLSNGDTIPFSELVDMYSKGIVYEGISFSIEKGVFEKAMLEHPRITKYVDELVEVTLEDDSVWLCTPDHLWLVGSEYTRAENLTGEDYITKFDDLN